MIAGSGPARLTPNRPGPDSMILDPRRLLLIGWTGVAPFTPNPPVLNLLIECAGFSS